MPAWQSPACRAAHSCLQCASWVHVKHRLLANHRVLHCLSVDMLFVQCVGNGTPVPPESMIVSAGHSLQLPSFP